MKKIQESEERVDIGLGRVAAFIGAATAAVVFTALYSAWSFSRGLLLQLNFPPSALSLKGTLDLFPEVGIAYTISLVFMLAIGFLIAAPNQQRLRKRKVIAYVLLGILFAIMFINTLEPRSQVYRWLVVTATFFGPIVVGLTYGTESHRLKRTFVVFLAILVVFRIYSYHLYSLGREKAEQVLSLRQTQSGDRGMAVSKLEEFPIVTVVSREKLLLNMTPRESDGSFVYMQSDSGFIRLVFSDSDRMYFVERYKRITTSLAVTKAKIEQLVFHSLEQDTDQ